MEDEKGDFWKAQYLQLKQMTGMKLREKEGKLKQVEEELRKARQDLEAKNVEITELKMQLAQRDEEIEKLREIVRSGTDVIPGMQETERNFRSEIESLQPICALQQSDMTQNVKQQGGSTSGSMQTKPKVGMFAYGADDKVDVEELKELGYDENEMASFIEASMINLDQETSVGGALEAAGVNPTNLEGAFQEELVEPNPLEPLQEKTQPSLTGLAAPLATVAPNANVEQERVSCNMQPTDYVRDMTNRMPLTSRMESKKTAKTPRQAYDEHQFALPTFEKNEIFNYPQIYFLGLEANKINGGEDSRDTRCFDDEQGFYRFVPGDHVAYRYELVDQVGKGTTAQVFSAIDHLENRRVAIKVMRSQTKYFRRAKAEIAMLERLKKLNENGDVDVVQMFNHFQFRNHECIVFEPLAENLETVIKMTGRQDSPLSLVRNFANSLIKVLGVLGRNKIVHGDLKPDNILLQESGKSAIKIIDFGLATFDRQHMQDVIQALHFRAPEVILGAKYGPEVDMWSAGLIIAELFTGKRLLPGWDVSDQLALGIEIFGVPPPAFLEVCSRTKNFIVDGVAKYADADSNAHSRGPPGSRDLSTALNNCADPRFVDFIRGCLNCDPKARLTPSQALCHPVLTDKTASPNDAMKCASLPASEGGFIDHP